MEGAVSSCIFCQIARSATSTTLLHKDDRVVAFQDINPSAFRSLSNFSHFHLFSVCLIGGLSITPPPPFHPPPPKGGQRSKDFLLVSHMLNVGQNLVQRDAPHAKRYRFGFHQPPLNSVNHLHLHCFALPFIPRWKRVKYSSLGPFGGFIEADKLLDRIKPLYPL
ncbi:bifunctional adenosine 5'-phosphosulfate phosphorylase/adenylylsulfatase HINT4 [Olea europaea var. sylvestris]|uniref:bifunctional adenosine 5'-phosphosulfate phosphorylase/adenylylsulfatase HINT4 n=1 Tax=Olea europaea var. sylvestris TaxID=158386 RepID=UPI000C1D134E|nr:bifunctional adenosine 5'-phosphosulfate phosphorylase/adenylylsulfatase HINT4 [Olea europaea var. sylvestris]